MNAQHSKDFASQVLTASVVPGQETLVTVRVDPHRDYRLSHPSDPKNELRLDSDQDGLVRFHLNVPKRFRSSEVQLNLTGGDGRGPMHRIAISPDVHFWPPPAGTQEAKAVTKGTVRPALTGELRGLTDRELVSNGYPPRPSAEKSWEAHLRWRDLVSRRFVAVNPFRLERAEARFGHRPEHDKAMSPTLPLPPPNAELQRALKTLRPLFPRSRHLERSFFNANYCTWSGVVIQQPVNNFFLVQADWQVPKVSPAPPSIPRSEAAMWVGLGNSPNDLFQAGTDSVSVNFGVGLGEDVLTATNYWMWIQVLPFTPWAVPDFPLSPGDEITVNIHVADQAGNTWFQIDNEGGGLTAQDDSVWFMLYNRTRGLSYWGTVPTATTQDQFNGNFAEFIIEQPSNGSGGTWGLANFGTARMRNCAFGDAQFGNLQQFPVNPDDGSQPFDGALAYVNMVNPSTNHRLATAISCPDSTGFGGNDIFWLWSNYQ